MICRCSIPLHVQGRARSMPAFDIIGPLPPAEVLVRWQLVEGGAACRAWCKDPFIALLFVSGQSNRPTSERPAGVDKETLKFVAEFRLQSEQEWAVLRFLNGDFGMVQLQAGVPVRTLALGVEITFEEIGGGDA
jgi:hypothetical protein